MTENQAAAIIRETTCTQCPYGYYCGKIKSCGNYECEKRKIVLEALKALESMEELWKYRAIGTVEECRKAINKQIARNCNREACQNQKYCDCGQKLKWEEIGE